MGKTLKMGEVGQNAKKEGRPEMGTHILLNPLPGYRL